MTFKEGISLLAAFAVAKFTLGIPNIQSKDALPGSSLEQRVSSPLQTRTPRPRPYGSPAIGIISSLCGKRISPCTGKETFHYGIDIANNLGTDIHTTMDGNVVIAEYLDGKGNTVVIQGTVGSITWKTKYFHCSEILVAEGQKVFFGDIIAKMGDSGTSTAPHVHYEIWKNEVLMDPSDASFGIPDEQYAKVQPKSNKNI
jgi:murein DD-endopeptidase MepM/ murein hydrolase activator NlpD